MFINLFKITTEFLKFASTFSLVNYYLPFQQPPSFYDVINRRTRVVRVWNFKMYPIRPCYGKTMSGKSKSGKFKSAITKFGKDEVSILWCVLHKLTKVKCPQSVQGLFTKIGLVVIKSNR